MSISIWKDQVTDPLQSVTFKGAWLRAQLTQGAHGDVYFDELVDLYYGDEYFLGFDGGFGNASVTAITVAQNAHLDAFPGGREVYAACYTTEWVKVMDKRLFWDLILAEM